MATSPSVKRGMAKRRAKHIAWLNSIKAQPCIDCGGVFPPECMDFDHRDKDSKHFGIAQATCRSIQSLLTEIAKCDLVCANCHRIRTHKNSSI